MQLKMGLGKSSVIVPMVAATLADRTKLVRVIVLKSLSEQMFQLLVEKLGGLIGRRVYRLPISRGLKPNLETANLIQSILKECMACGGVLLVQPESILSFELLGIDYVLARELGTPLPEAGITPDSNAHDDLQISYKTGKVMVKTQQWLYENTRDILDESDEILSVKYELIYTLGVQNNVQFGPDREPYAWETNLSHSHRVLAVLSETAREILGGHPEVSQLISTSKRYNEDTTRKFFWIDLRTRHENLLRGYGSWHGSGDCSHVYSPCGYS
ncbi:uncharacterized protein RAG0_04617 [Rhynchosporium agropyri]|uniref:ubiquitinyl hydrolase 1 n=1 Tax=Rhynchosporium agropyri TaxID=914238 RepID=A0A1E1K9T0_9HELO|nr:uncharacterized protein RAG0_04617 [Rhynchosporium agropyri]